MDAVCPKCSRKYGAGTIFCDIDGAKLISQNGARPRIQQDELQLLLHPTEHSRFMLALLVAIPVAIVAIVLVFVSFGLLLVYVGLITFSVWFGLSIAKASLMANSVRVSAKNFPAIHEVTTEVKYTLDYDEPIDIYIIEEGSVNAFLAKFFQTKFIILNSELVKDMLDNGKIVQMKWIIARFVGALKAKHFRLNLLRIVIDSIEKIKIFNLFILPYERATQYSGDQIGLAVCNDLNQAMTAFDKFMVGNDLADRVEFQGLIEQALDVRDSFFAMLARLFSTHPHMVSRYLNLLAFARWRYPRMFDEYIARFDGATSSSINAILPNYAYELSGRQELQSEEKL